MKLPLQPLAFLVVVLAGSVSAEEPPELPEAAVSAVWRGVVSQAAAPDERVNWLPVLVAIEIGGLEEADPTRAQALRSMLGRADLDPLVAAEAARSLWTSGSDARLRGELEAVTLAAAREWLDANVEVDLTELGRDELFRVTHLLHYAREFGLRIPRARLDDLRSTLATDLSHEADVALMFWVGANDPAKQRAKEVREATRKDPVGAAEELLEDPDALARVLVHRRSSRHDKGYREWAGKFCERLWQDHENREDLVRLVWAHEAVNSPTVGLIADRAPGAPAADLRAVLTDTIYGPLLLSIEPEGAAARAGIQEGEVIVRVGKDRVRDSVDLNRALRRYTEADVVEAVVEAQGQPRTVSVEFDRKPRWRRPSVGQLKSPGDDAEGRHWSEWDKEDFARLPTPRDPKRIERKQLEEAAKKVQESLPWEKKLEDALARAATEGKPVFWYLPQGWKPKKRDGQASPTYAGGDYEAYVRTTLFHYDTTRELLEERFVLLDQNPTKEQAAKYGILRFHFYDPGWIVLSPEGDKLWEMDEIATYGEGLFDHALRSFLAVHPRFARDGGGTAEGLLRAGEVGVLIARGAETTADLVPLGHAQLRAGSLDAARESLGRALEAARVDATLREPALQLALTLAMREGEDVRAEKCARALTTSKDPAQRAHGLEALSRLAWKSGNEAEALRLWRQLVTDHHDQPEAAWAAHCLLGKAALQHSCELVLATEAPVLQTLPTSTICAYPKEEAAEVAAQALRSLLSYQNGDGSFRDTPYAWMGPEHRPNTIMAISGIAARALLAWREVDPPAVDAALARVESYLQDHGNYGITPIEKCYAYAYPLRFWTDAALAREGDAKEVAVREATRLAEKLAKIQHDLAGWGHEYYNPFSTGVSLQSQALARDAGIPVPPGSVEKARATLEGLRHPTGGFPYGFSQPNTTLYASTGRAPICELSILLAGGSSEARVIRALSNFFEHREQLDMTRRYDFHADKFANGGFFFWHDVLPVAEAITRLSSEPAKERFRDELLEMITGSCEPGGAWCDSQNIGRSYGTAMALLSLKELLR